MNYNEPDQTGMYSGSGRCMHVSREVRMYAVAHMAT